VANIFWHLDEVQRTIDGKVQRGLDSLANAIVKDIQNGMKNTPEGTDYRPKWKREGECRPKERATTQQIRPASKPGNPPAVQTGTLWRSIHIQKVGKARRVGSTLKGYPVWLETGTKDKHGKPKMAARPWLRPSVEKLTGRPAELILHRATATGGPPESFKGSKGKVAGDPFE